jgi:hypothetical protein
LGEVRRGSEDRGREWIRRGRESSWEGEQLFVAQEERE